MGAARFLLVAAACAAVLSVTAVASANPGRVMAQDDCDAASFNLAVGPGTCVGSGTTTFGDFIGQLTERKRAGAWHFSPNRVDVRAGSSLVFDNRGGETHSLTEVTQFGGGGIVPPINQILFGTVSPPTFFFGPLNLVPAGGSLTIPAATLTPGTHLFFCAIHPWMQETVQVS